jgi:hypothetical protein
MGRQAWFAHLHNPGTESHTIDAKSWAECDHAWWLDGWRNVWWRFDETTAEVTIPPLSSLLFFCNYAEPSGEAAPTLDLPAQVVSSAVLPGWTLTVTGDDVEGGEYHGEFTSPLPDWRDLEELRYSSSLGTYSTLFELPATSGRHILKVEQVRGSATVRVNGETAGELLVSPFEIEITDLLTEGTNAVELAFTPPLRNRLVGHANANDPAYPQFKTDPEQLAPTGIVGEIVLVERL